MQVNNITIDETTVDIDQLKIDLKDNEIEFGGRSGLQRLITLAVEGEISIPLLDGDPLEAPDYSATSEEEEEEEEEPGEGEEPDEDEEAESHNVVPEKYRKRYGAKQNCGDDMALTLKDFVTKQDDKAKNFCDTALLQHVADQNGVSLAAWSHLNLGMQRMNLGNVLRGKLNKGQRVEVGDQVWEARTIDPEDEDAPSKM